MPAVFTLMAALAVTVPLATQPIGVKARSVASCESIVMQSPPAVPVAGDRIVLNRVAAPPKQYPGSPSQLRHGSLRYWAKAGLLVRPGTLPVDVIVPVAWRNQVAIEWGDSGIASGIRIRGCSATGSWLPYTGGFYLRQPACVPLVVRSGGQTAHIRVAIGRDCPET